MILNVGFEGIFVLQLKRSCVQTVLAPRTGHGAVRRRSVWFPLAAPSIDQVYGWWFEM